MKNDRLTRILLLIIAAALVLTLVRGWRAEPTLFLGGETAHAQQAPGTFFVLDKDSFIITASNEGDTVYLYYFNRKPMKNESSIEFISKTTAK